MIRTDRIALVLAAAIAASGCAHFRDTSADSAWYKGNTHTHTLWSDGDAAPEWVVAEYKDRGYDFLCLSDHNLLLEGETWFPIESEGYLNPERVAQLQQRFGNDWVELRGRPQPTAMRLKTLDELKLRFEDPDKFILVPAEEISANFRDTHVNAVNLMEPVNNLPPETSQVDAINTVFEAVEEQSRRYDVPMLAHVNHPNWSGAIAAEVLVEVGGERFFEIYNGHGGVRNWGDPAEAIPSMERKWDIILAMRFRQGDTSKPLYGVATDDTHAYFEERIGLANAFRGWIMVRAKALTPEALIRALKRGDFYSSSGVTLNDVRTTKRRYEVHIDAEPGVTYRTEFIGTPVDFDPQSSPAVDADGQVRENRTRQYSAEIGQLLAATTANPAVYEFQGNELYVRARVVSSKLQHNPHARGDLETAWTQPVQVAN